MEACCLVVERQAWVGWFDHRVFVQSLVEGNVASAGDGLALRLEWPHHFQRAMESTLDTERAPIGVIPNQGEWLAPVVFLSDA